MKRKIFHLFRAFDRKILGLFVFSLVTFILFTLLLYERERSQAITRSLVDHTNQTIVKIDAVNIALTESESAIRSFLFTKDTAWEKEMRSVHDSLNERVAELDSFTSNNIIQQKNIQKLQVQIQKKEAFQNALLSGKFSKVQEIQKVSRGGEGSQITLSIKKTLAETLKIEKNLLADKIKENEISYLASKYITLSGGIFSLVLVLVVLFQLNADISLRKKAEKEVFNSEAKYRNLIENAAVVMYTAGITGNINFVNNQVTALTGYSADELNGKHFSILLDPSYTNSVVSFYAKQFTSKTTASTLEFPIRTKSGEQKWVEQSAQLLLDAGQVAGFQCMVKDITEKKKVEQALSKSEYKRKENEYRLTAILDNSTALIYIKDLEGRYVTANKRFVHFLGLTEEQVIGHTDYDFTTKELADHYRKLDEEIFASLQPMQTEEFLETPEGNKNLLLLKFPLITPDNVLIGISGIATDVTEKNEIQKKLMLALQKAEAAQQIQEQFLANMSHEIRTPMNGIQGMTRLLLETKLTEEQEGFAIMINRSLNNLVVIVNNVLDYSNLKTGKLIFDKVVFNLSEILEEIKKQFARQVSVKGIDFTISINDTVPNFLKGDAFRLKQVLVNLAGNAVKFTKAGRVEIQVSVQQKKADQADILFTISDTGIGIAEEKLETIFESFAQASKNISSGYGGAGLGLTISKGLIELQGGSISVKSKTGDGSVFTFHIPFWLTEEQNVTSQKNDYAAQLSGKKILVVEDNLVNQKLISFVLQKMNIVIAIAANGKEAISLCEKNVYDLIIMDLQMPIMDGYETTIYLRQEMNLQTPIIAMTATALKEDQDRSSFVGMNDFMIKPFDFNDLYTRLVRILFHKPVSQTLITKEETEDEKLFDLSLLEELDDTGALLEVLAMFFENTPAEIIKLKALADTGEQDAVYKLAHKLKSAVAILQSTRLTELLRNIESNAKEAKNIPETNTMIAEVVVLFARMETLLRAEMERINKEHSTNS